MARFYHRKARKDYPQAGILPGEQQEKLGNMPEGLQARSTSFRRYGMTVVESSPTDGILSLYNEGDRRRFYWPCYSCGNAFEPDFSLLKWDTVDGNLSKTAKTVRLECPHCGARYHEDLEEPEEPDDDDFLSRIQEVTAET